MVDRRRPDAQWGEREMLVGWLEYHRATLLLKCQGLTDEQLRQRSVPPSTMSLHGLVRHCTEVERNWFERVFQQKDIQGLYYKDDDPDGVEFDNLESASFEDDVATFHAACDEARRVTDAAASLDDAGVRRGEAVSLRWILNHMIEEYARHNGHADLLRECIDGATGV
jgi:uncharacterized damage-inducible protein DinB